MTGILHILYIVYSQSNFHIYQMINYNSCLNSGGLPITCKHLEGARSDRHVYLALHLAHLSGEAGFCGVGQGGVERGGHLPPAALLVLHLRGTWVRLRFVCGRSPPAGGVSIAVPRWASPPPPWRVESPAFRAAERTDRRWPPSSPPPCIWPADVTGQPVITLNRPRSNDFAHSTFSFPLLFKCYII